MTNKDCHFRKVNPLNRMNKEISGIYGFIVLLHIFLFFESLVIF
ncbi:hypothetical protein MY9_1533 [Bacillus sp. JS]|nr:hypothetical protein MY9_1533 [Bacillus sp. JS]